MSWPDQNWRAKSKQFLPRVKGKECISARQAQSGRFRWPCIYQESVQQPQKTTAATRRRHRQHWARREQQSRLLSETEPATNPGIMAGHDHQRHVPDARETILQADFSSWSGWCPTRGGPSESFEADEQQVEAQTSRLSVYRWTVQVNAPRSDCSKDTKSIGRQGT